MSDLPRPIQDKKTWNLPLAVMLALPLLALGVVIALFTLTGGGLQHSDTAQVENLSVERVLLYPGQIQLVVRNAGPRDLTIAQVVINGAVWPASFAPSATLPRLGSATVSLDYMWESGEAYDLLLFSSRSIAFPLNIPLALETPRPNAKTFLSFTLIGLYVGVLPVYLGLVWFPALRRLGRRWMTFLLAVTAGLLVFLGVDTVVEALDQAGKAPAPLQGIGLASIGALAAFFTLETLSHQQAAQGRSEADERLALSYRIAAGIGLHNLGEGLAIGAAYNLGQAALGSFLVIGFILQNITEGLGIIAPVLRDRPRLGQLALLGLLGGGPAILGAWLGGFAPSPVLAVLFLGVGAGAIFQVVLEIARLLRKDTVQAPMPATIFSGVVAGMLILWATGLIIK